MDATSAGLLKKRLDNTVFSLTEMIKKDIYENTIVGAVQDWFESNASIKHLNENIKRAVNDRWPFVEKKVNSRLFDFEEETKTILSGTSQLNSQGMNQEAIAEGVSEGISYAVGALGSAIVGMICGGAGTALIASGPIGWIIGAIAGGVAFFVGKSTIEGAISDFIVDKKIPKIAKKTARKKVFSQLKQGENKFEEDVYNLLSEKLKPVYEAINEGISK